MKWIKRCLLTVISTTTELDIGEGGLASEQGLYA